MADASKPWMYSDGREQNPVYQQDVRDFQAKGLNAENAHRAADLFYDLEVHGGITIRDDPVYQELLRSADAHWDEFADDYEHPWELAAERYKEIVIGEAAGLVDTDEFNVPTVSADVLQMEPEQPAKQRWYGR